MIKNWAQKVSLVSNNNKNFTWKTVGTFQSLNRHCQRIIPTPQCRNIKVGLIVQNSPHGYVKCNHRVCEFHRFPASILNKVILLMISRTSNNTFLFLFHFMHLHLTGSLFFKHPIASFIFFSFTTNIKVRWCMVLLKILPYLCHPQWHFQHLHWLQ